MIASLIQIGNSTGIRIPKKLLEILNMTEKVQLSVQKDGFLVRPVSKKSREGWAEQFAQSNPVCTDMTNVEVINEWDDTEWTW